MKPLKRLNGLTLGTGHDCEENVAQILTLILQRFFLVAESPNESIGNVKV